MESLVFGLALDVCTLAVLRLVRRYLVSGKGVPFRGPVELVLGEVEGLVERYGLGEVVDGEDLLEACSGIVHSSAVPVNVGRTRGEAGLEVIGDVIADRRASVLFVVTDGVDEFDLVMEELGIAPRDVRARARRLLVWGDVDEDGLSSWAEEGFEVAVARGEGPGLNLCYTDNVMAIASVGLTRRGLDGLRRGEGVVTAIVSNMKAPVDVLTHDPLGFTTVASFNLHTTALHDFLHGRPHGSEEPLPEHERLRRDLREELRRYLHEGPPHLLWWLGPERHPSPR